jgi:biotin-(acetyl-CoA carboxylase) ligase
MTRTYTEADLRRALAVGWGYGVADPDKTFLSDDETTTMLQQLNQEYDDNAAVDKFAQRMKAKLAAARAKGRSGWQSCDTLELRRMLRQHVEKGDPVDVANFCMFLEMRGEKTTRGLG